MRRLLCSVSFSLALLALSGNAQAGFVDEESVAAAASTAEAAAAPAQRGPTLDDFLTVVKNTLNKVKLDKDQPPLKKVAVNLKTSSEVTDGGTFKIFVISFGTTNTNSSEETLNIDLTGELGKEAGAEAAAAAPPPVSTRLAGTIQAAFASLKEAGFDNNSKPLSTSGLSLTQKFIVKSGNTIGATVDLTAWTIVPVSIGLSGGQAKGFEQQIVFEFAKPEPEKKAAGNP
jgi:hypothetical protein